MKPIRRFAAATLIAALATGLVGMPAFAGAPEVKFDPVTGIDLPNPDLETALAEIEGRGHVRYAQECRQCAPWITTTSVRETASAGAWTVHKAGHWPSSS